MTYHAKQGEDIFAQGVLDVVSDGYGFIRVSSSYAAGPCDIYVSPNQIRRAHLKTGDTILCKVRPPKQGERYFCLGPS